MKEKDDFMGGLGGWVLLFSIGAIAAGWVMYGLGGLALGAFMLFVAHADG